MQEETDAGGGGNGGVYGEIQVRPFDRLRVTGIQRRERDESCDYVESSRRATTGGRPYDGTVRRGGRIAIRPYIG